VTRSSRPKKQVKDSAASSKGPKKKRDFNPWDTFTSVASTGLSLPLLFTPHMVGFGSEVTRIITGQSKLAPRKDDHRFDDPNWWENPVYKASMQTYLAWCGGLEELMAASQLRGKDKEKAASAVRIMTHSLSPSESLSNVNVARHAFETRGASLVHGMRRLGDDMFRQTGMVKNKNSQFIPGKSIACTRGTVVYRTDQLELIRYTPTQPSTYKRPLLIIPSPINKFYIFDLSPENSLVKYLLSQGIDVYIASWRSPTSKQSDWGLEKYIGALVDCCREIKKAARIRTINLAGYSAGGIFTALLANILNSRPLGIRVNSATYMGTNFDTHIETQAGMVLNDQLFDAAKTLSKMRGVLTGQELASMFVWMRPNNLLWNAWVSNYFVGEDLPGEDVMYWNLDPARLPSALHCDFLDMYRDAPLLEANRLHICNTDINLAKLDCDFYLLAGSSDHITPWQACYNSSGVLAGKREFVLVNRGYTRSIVCPPGTENTRFFTHKPGNTSAEEWLSEAEQHKGSWWPHWADWLKSQSGKMSPPMQPSFQKVTRNRAPGKYILD